MGEDRLRASALPTARPAGRRRSASPTRLEPHPESEVRAGTTARVHSVFLVRSGKVQLARHTPSGHPLILTVAKPGDILAEASVYPLSYHCGAIAAEPAVIAAPPRNAFRGAIYVDRNLSECWATKLASSLQAARTKAEIRTLGKVADSLEAWLAAGQDLPEKGMLQDVAAEISISREALYRELPRRRTEKDE